MVVLRYNADGSPDAGFGTGGQVAYSPGGGRIADLTKVIVQPDGKLLAEANLDGMPGTLYHGLIGGVALVRFNVDGTVDGSFGRSGLVEFGTDADPLGPYPIYRPTLPYQAKVGPADADMIFSASDVLVQADGKIVVGGTATAFVQPAYVGQGYLARLNPDGSPDSAFGPDGVLFTTLYADQATYRAVDPRAIGPAPDGSLIVFGNLDYGSILPELGAPPMLMTVRFSDAPPAGTGTPPPATPPDWMVVVPPVVPPLPMPTPPGAPADAIFQLLATGPLSTAGPPVGSTAPGSPFGPPIGSPSPTAPLPIPGTSQSAAVARLSGGGGGVVSTDDPFAIAGEPDRLWNLVLADEIGTPA
jgi:uncharacterized delta-60 repeat protein